jgi:hypothetical protein
MKKERKRGKEETVKTREEEEKKEREREEEVAAEKAERLRVRKAELRTKALFRAGETAKRVAGERAVAKLEKQGLKQEAKKKRQALAGAKECTKGNHNGEGQADSEEKASSSLKRKRAID